MTSWKHLGQNANQSALLLARKISLYAKFWQNPLRPLILLGHSLGGILIKQVFPECQLMFQGQYS